MRLGGALPRPVKRLLRRAAYQVRRLGGGAQVTRTDIAGCLADLGIGAGHDVFLHSSMRGLGVIRGGADAALDAVRDVIGPAGTLLVPAYPLATSMFEHLARGGIVLDVRHTPSRMGKVSETLRLRPGARRSLHPTHSVAALGPRADEYCREHVTCTTPCGPGSPFVKLIEHRGWIVALGSPIGKVTAYHVLEDRARSFPIAVYLEQQFEVGVIDDAGESRQLRVRSHDPAIGPRRIDNNRQVEVRFERLLRERGVLREQRLGTGTIAVMRADALERALEELLQEGITIYAS